VVTGKILRFDEFRGYGFIAPDDGGEDVFMHANDLLDDKYRYRAGLRVSFGVEDGDRGLKATDVQLLDPPIGPPPATRRAPATTSRPVGPDEDDDGLLDVLSRAQFERELTDVLLEAVPTLTAAQVLQVRRHVADLAQSHNWVEP
jgi:cold shock CspA family protein